MKTPISVIIPVKNEEANLRECLQSVAWADEVFVVDSQSTDRTCDIAREFGATPVQFQYDGGWPKKKNWALQNLPFRNNWIFILDADERVPDTLRAEMEVAIQNPHINGYYIRWKFMFLGRWMKHSWSHGWILRLLRKGCGEFEDLGMRGEAGWDNEVHENIVATGKTACLNELLLHHSNQDLHFWLRKQNEFSDWNAIRRFAQSTKPLPKWQDLFASDHAGRRKLLKALFIRLPAKPLLLFLYLYFIKKGFLDGRAGLYFCALRAAHELNICAKVYERSISVAKK